MASVVDIILDGDGACKDWETKEIIHLGNDAPPVRFVALEGGMKSGRPSVMIGIYRREQSCDGGNEHAEFPKCSADVYGEVWGSYRARAIRIG